MKTTLVYRGLPVVKTPNAIRDSAVTEFKTGLKGNFTSLSRGHIKNFKRKCKVNETSIEISAAHLGGSQHLAHIIRLKSAGKTASAHHQREQAAFQSILDEGYTRQCAKLQAKFNAGKRKTATPRCTPKTTHTRKSATKVEHHPRVWLPRDARICRNEYGDYVLHIAVSVDIRPKVVGLPPAIIAIDPGVRIFATGYVASNASELNGATWELGNAIDMSKVKSLVTRAHRLKKISHTLPKKKRCALRKKAKKFRRRARNLVDTLHFKVANDMLRVHDKIIWPALKTKDMHRRGGRLDRGTKASLRNWSHFRFNQVLRHKARSYPHCLVVDDQGERYTTQACGGCGHLNKAVGSARVYECARRCGYMLARDVHGARNILIKYHAEAR